jgi:hypothetical protein
LSSDIVNFLNDLAYELEVTIINGIQSINELLKEIIFQAQNGVNVHERFSSFIESNVNVTFCRNDEPLYNMSELNPIYGYAIYLFTPLRTLVHKNLSSSWIKQTELWEVFQGYFQFFNTVGDIFISSDSNEADKYENSKSEILMISLICLLGYFVICFPLLFILSILSFKELDKLLKIMQNVDPTIRRETASPLKAKNHEQPPEEHHESFKSSVFILLGLIILISVFVLIRVTFILIIYFIAY